MYLRTRTSGINAYSEFSQTLPNRQIKMTVTGYQRLDQLNIFVPRDIKNVLKANIGKNEMVNVTDFLMGDDYSKVENPYLPKGLQDEIRNHPGMTKEVWAKRVKGMLEIVDRNDGNHRQIEDLAYVLRYVTLYPLANNNKHFVQIVINKCLDLKENSIPQFICTNKMVEPLQHPHFTRKNKEKKDIADDYFRAITGCLRTIDECLDLYETALAEIQYQECQAVMRL